MKETATPPTVKTKRTRKTRDRRAPRVVDEDEKTMKLEHKAALHRLRLTKKSVGLLVRITESCERLTPEHRKCLSQELSDWDLNTTVPLTEREAALAAADNVK